MLRTIRESLSRGRGHFRFRPSRSIQRCPLLLAEKRSVAAGRSVPTRMPCQARLLLVVVLLLLLIIIILFHLHEHGQRQRLAE